MIAAAHILLRPLIRIDGRIAQGVRYMGTWYGSDTLSLVRLGSMPDWEVSRSRPSKDGLVVHLLCPFPSTFLSRSRAT